jgi:alpha-glucosidase
VVVDRYHALEATFRNEAQQEIVIEFRVYDDGVGMRYRLLGEGSDYVMDECSSFAFVEDCEAHWIAGSYDDDEFAYMHTPMSEITVENMAHSSSGNRKLPYPSVNTPVALVTSRGTHIAIHEAALWSYPAMSLRYDSERNMFTSDLASLQDVKVPVALPFATPWRVIIVGDRAGALAESTIVLNLNEPCRLEDTSWIKPMKYVGVWWEMHLKLSTWDSDGGAPHCATTENVKRYIDFAAENGFGGVLVEGVEERGRLRHRRRVLALRLAQVDFAGGEIGVEDPGNPPPAVHLLPRRLRRPQRLQRGLALPSSATRRPWRACTR